jgi:hypothetical protein
MTENMSKAKWTTYIGKLFKERTKSNYRERKLKAFHKSPEYRTAATSSFSEFHLPRQLSASSSTSTATPNPSHLTPAIGRGSLSHVLCRIDKHLYYLPPTIARYRMIFIDLATTTPILMIPDKRP